MAAAVGKVDMNLLSGDAHMAWMEHKKALEKILAEAAGSQDEHHQAARAAAASCPTRRSRWRNDFPRRPTRPYYVIHCPMAFEGRGADGSDDTKDVHNPYFGAAMPTCGNVEVIRRAIACRPRPEGAAK